MNMDNIFVLLIEQEGDFCMFYVHPLVLAIVLVIMTRFSVLADRIFGHSNAAH